MNYRCKKMSTFALLIIMRAMTLTLSFLSAESSPHIKIDEDNPNYLVCISKHKNPIDFSIRMNILAQTVPNMADTLGRFVAVKKSGIILAHCLSEDNDDGEIYRFNTIQIYKATNSKKESSTNSTAATSQSNKLSLFPLHKKKLTSMASLNPELDVNYDIKTNTYSVKCWNKYPVDENQELRLIRITNSGKRIPIMMEPGQFTASFKDQSKSISVAYTYNFTQSPTFFNNSFECRTTDSYTMAHKIKLSHRVIFPVRIGGNVTIQLLNKDIIRTSKQMKYFDVKAYPNEFYLECSIGLAHPSPVISWSDMEGRIYTGSTIRPSILNISQEYCCTVQQKIEFAETIRRSCLSIKFNQPPMPGDCNEVRRVFHNASNGVYSIYPRYKHTKQRMIVFCDLQSDKTAWIKIQRRYDGRLDFAKSWLEYKDGFGDLENEFWLGNEKIHQLSHSRPIKIRFDLWDKHQNHKFAQYDNFSVGGKEENFKISISGYHGDAGDSFNYGGDAANNIEFSTADKDNDHNKKEACSKLFGGGGGFWFNNCGRVNLNGEYLIPGTNSRDGIIWYTFSNNWKSLKRTEIRIAFKDED